MLTSAQCSLWGCFSIFKFSKWVTRKHLHIHKCKIFVIRESLTSLLSSVLALRLMRTLVCHSSCETGPEPALSESWPGLLFPESRPLFSSTWGWGVFMGGCVGWGHCALLGVITNKRILQGPGRLMHFLHSGRGQLASQCTEQQGCLSPYWGMGAPWSSCQEQDPLAIHVGGLLTAQEHAEGTQLTESCMLTLHSNLELILIC